MTIIDQLESLITPAIVGDESSVASISLLEQFYAILVSRLAIADVYNQLQRNQASIAEHNDSIFKQLWTQSSERELIISELAQTHHFDEIETEHLLTNAAHLGFEQLKALANDQFLPAFLQSKQAAIRHHLPIWASEIIAVPLTANAQKSLSKAGLSGDAAAGLTIMVADTEPRSAMLGIEELSTDKLSTNELSIDIQDSREQIVTIVEETIVINDDLNDTSVENALIMPMVNIDKDDGISYQKRNETNATKAPATELSADDLPAYINPNTQAIHQPISPRHNWLVPILLLIIALTALALLWFLVIQPKFMQPAAPVVIEPVIIKDPAPVAAVLKPAQLIIAVDNTGSLYTCTATIGDANLQNSLRQVLSTSFGEQARICEFTLEQGVATDLANITINRLPEILTLVRATPFARLELQDSSIRLEAPDSSLLQQLATNMRSLLPTTSVTTTDPTPLLNDVNSAYNDNNLNNPNDTFNNGTFNNETEFNNPTNDPNLNYQASDDDTNDRVVPTPSPNNNSVNNFNSINNSNGFDNSNNRNNAFSDRNQSSGSISESEVDNLANTSIVAEPLRNARPVDRNIANNN